MSESAVIDFSSMGTPALPTETPETPSTPEVESPEAVETPVEHVEGAEPGGDGSEPSPKPDSSKPASLKAIRDAVKAYEAANPEQGKLLRSLLDGEGRFRAFQELHPDGIEGARSLKAAVEAAGGIEGISKLAKLQDFVDDTNAQWDAGDPEALEAVFEGKTDGAVKLLPHYLNRVEKVNPEAFGTALKPHLVRNLEGAQFPSVVGGMLRVIAGSVTPEQKLATIKESIESMAQWFDSQKREAEKTNLDSLEPERGKLKDEWGKVNTEKQRIFQSEVNSDVAPHFNKLFGEQMGPYAKALAALPSDAMRQNVAKAWADELGKAFGKQHHDHMETMMKSKGRNKAAIANYAKTRMSAVASEVTKKIVDAYKLTPGAAAPPKKQAAGGNNDKGPDATNAIRVNQKPPDEQIDWDRDPDRMLFISGRAYLKGSNGQKLVKWR